MNDCESGYWAFNEAQAARMIGDSIYLHEKQKAPSRVGGQIVSYRVHQGPEDSEYIGRIIFRFSPNAEQKGVLAEGTWSRWYLRDKGRIHLFHDFGNSDGLLRQVKS